MLFVCPWFKRYFSCKRYFSKIYLPLLFLTLMLILLPQPSDANMRLCGFKLTTTLKAICKNQVCGGHLLEKQKRAYLTSAGTISFLRHAPKSTDNSEILQRFTRSSHGIASECCQKRCTLTYLRTYCCSTGFATKTPKTTETIQNELET